MSSAGNGQTVPYVVRLSTQTKTIVKDLHAQAIQNGSGQQVLAAFRQIVGRLGQDPLTFGEPLYRLPALQLIVHQAVVLPLVVVYAVHEDQPVVFIRGIKVLS